MITQWGWDSDYECDEYPDIKFYFDGTKLIARNLHPRFFVYSEVDCPDLLNKNLLEVHLYRAALNIMRHKDQWIKECEERNGQPPPEMPSS
jgi:hypothetical protein